MKTVRRYSGRVMFYIRPIRKVWDVSVLVTDDKGVRHRQMFRNVIVEPIENSDVYSTIVMHVHVRIMDAGPNFYAPGFVSAYMAGLNRIHDNIIIESTKRGTTHGST